MYVLKIFCSKYHITRKRANIKKLERPIAINR